MTAHESPRTTKLYDRTKDEITIGEVYRRKKKTRRWRKPASGSSRTALSAGIIS
jgi:hypothetical protein